MPCHAIVGLSSKNQKVLVPTTYFCFFDFLFGIMACHVASHVILGPSSKNQKVLMPTTFIFMSCHAMSSSNQKALVSTTYFLFFCFFVFFIFLTCTNNLYILCFDLSSCHSIAFQISKQSTRVQRFPFFGNMRECREPHLMYQRKMCVVSIKKERTF